MLNLEKIMFCLKVSYEKFQRKKEAMHLLTNTFQTIKNCGTHLKI